MKDQGKEKLNCVDCHRQHLQHSITFVRILLLHFQQLETSNYKAAFAIVVCQTKRQVNLQQTTTATGRGKSAYC